MTKITKTFKLVTNQSNKLDISYTHFNTERILGRVSGNWNDWCYLSTVPVNECQASGTPEPQEINQELANELDKLFEGGADLILETNQVHDDEGGDCYQAYIVLPEAKKGFWEYWDDNSERDGLCLWQLCIMEYIVKFPSNVRMVWAGPY